MNLKTSNFSSFFDAADIFDKSNYFQVDLLYRDYIKFITSPQDHSHHTHLNSREFWSQLQNKDFENGTLVSPL